MDDSADARPAPRWLAGVTFKQPFRIDELMARTVAAFQARGVTVTGVTQTYTDNPGCSGSDLRLQAIGGGWEVPIMQPRGAHSTGCRLDYGAMADATQWIESALDEDAGLIVLNRFGRAESEGNGLRSILQRCAEDERPTLIAVREDYVGSWNEFHGGLGEVLPPDLGVVFDWFDSLPTIGRSTAASPPLAGERSSDTREI